MNPLGGNRSPITCSCQFWNPGKSNLPGFLRFMDKKLEKSYLRKVVKVLEEDSNTELNIGTVKPTAEEYNAMIDEFIKVLKDDIASNRRN